MFAFIAPILNSVFAQAFGSFVKAYQAKLASENTSEKIAADLAARELAVQQTEVQAKNQLQIAEIGHWYEPDKLFEYTLYFYFTKAVLWDKILSVWLLGHTGETDPIGGELGQWASMIMVFMFGTRRIENITRILKR